MSSSTWKLVEAEPEPIAPVLTEEPPRRGGYRGRRGGGPGRSSGRGGRGYRNHYGNDFMQQRDPNHFTSLAIQQIELIFSPDNLCMDTYVRAYMDVEGFVPIALVCNYPSVAYYGIPYENLVAKLLESQVLEVDSFNETIRLREDWSKWLMPNPFGGMGQPKYLKQVYPEGEVQSYEYQIPTDGSDQYVEQNVEVEQHNNSS